MDQEDFQDEDAQHNPFERYRKYGKNWLALPTYMGCDPVALRDVPLHILQKWHNFFIERRACLILDQKGPWQGCLNWEQHFMNMCSVIWEDPDWKFSLEWNPNIVKMLYASRKHKALALLGSASSGKTMFLVIFGLGMWLLDPDDTKIYYTSTTLLDSKGRGWGDIERYYKKWEEFWGPFASAHASGKLIASIGVIASVVGGIRTQKAGLQMIAGAKGESGASKIGFKAGTLIMLADEMTLLSDDIVNSFANLLSNDNAKLIVAGNPASYTDPLGKMAEPVDGYSSISDSDEEWDAVRGVKVLRFDGENSPNVIAGKELWKGLFTVEKLKEYQERYGRDSLGYWQFVRAYFSPTGRMDAIYYEKDFVTYRANRKVREWLETPIMLASLDPAFAHGGDSAVGSFGKFGTAQLPEGDRRVLECEEQIDYNRFVDKSANKSEEVARLFAEDVRKRGISVRNVVLDVSGGGAPFAALLATHLGYGFLEVNFSSKASTLPTAKSDTKEAHERYHNKVTELWYVGRSYLREQQLAGISADCSREMCSRDYKIVGKGTVQVEPKADMKKRTKGKSPDRADGFFLMLELARARHKFHSEEKAAPKKRTIQWDYEENRRVRKQRGAPRYSDLNYDGGGGWAEPVVQAY